MLIGFQKKKKKKRGAEKAAVGLVIHSLTSMKFLMNFFEPVHILSAATGQAKGLTSNRCVHFQGYWFI